ncbi:MAG TPA: ABC transporter permease [Bacteroidales bacterium]|nr:ABC transporter permease [Bacteroidales bacterium]
MNLYNATKIAFRALTNNRSRALLTMLGIIIGVAAVIAMLAIGQGSKTSIRDQISEMGSNMLTIRPGADQGPGGARMSADEMQTLKMEDYEAIRDQTSLLTAVSPGVSQSGQSIFGSNNAPTTLNGVHPDFLQIRKYALASGSMFTEDDVHRASKVCVIGKTVAESLFGEGTDPVGSILRFNKIPLRVIGVLESKGSNSMGMDQDDLILAPYTTVMKRMLAITYLQSIYASVIDESASEDAQKTITEILRTRHKLKEGEEDDFSVRSQQEMLSMMTSTSDMMTMLLAAVAGISLIVGGIGIMNIMYVSVTERTREIGLRLSIGARERDILLQFLIEAVFISITGGFIGVLLGIAASYSIQWIAMWPIEMQGYSIVLSFLVCSCTGIFFGWYPAKKASQLDPIDALRYE